MRKAHLAQELEAGRDRRGVRVPCPTVSVAHSPTPSVVRIAARSVGIGKKAAAACAWWCWVNRILSRATPSSPLMIPLTQTFDPSAFRIACTNARRERGKARRPWSGCART